MLSQKQLLIACASDVLPEGYTLLLAQSRKHSWNFSRALFFFAVITWNIKGYFAFLVTSQILVTDLVEEIRCVLRAWNRSGHHHIRNQCPFIDTGDENLQRDISELRLERFKCKVLVFCFQQYYGCTVHCSLIPLF